MNMCPDVGDAGSETRGVNIRCKQPNVWSRPARRPSQLSSWLLLIYSRADDKRVKSGGRSPAYSTLGVIPLYQQTCQFSSALIGAPWQWISSLFCRICLPIEERRRRLRLLSTAALQLLKKKNKVNHRDNSELMNDNIKISVGGRVSSGVSHRNS